MALYTHLSKQEIDLIVSHWGLRSPEKIKGILEGTVNTYYKLTYPDKIYYLKIDEVGKLDRLKKELRNFELLSKIKNKLSFAVTAPLLTIKKKSFIPWNKKFILLFEEVKGKIQKNSDLNVSKLYQIGKALATIHHLTLKARLPHHRFHFPELKNVYKQIKPKLSKRLPHVDKFIREQLESPLKENQLPSGLIHADLFAENILFIGSKLSGIIDYEAAGYGPFLFDICVAIHALCYQKNKLNVKFCQAFLKGYEEVRKMALIEKKMWVLMMQMSGLRFLLTRLRDFELKDGPVKAKPFKDYREYYLRLHG